MENEKGQKNKILKEILKQKDASYAKKFHHSSKRMYFQTKIFIFDCFYISPFYSTVKLSCFSETF